MPNQSKAEGYGAALSRIEHLMDAVASASREISRWTYPAPVDPAIVTELDAIQVLLNDARRKMTAIVISIASKKQAELP